MFSVTGVCTTSPSPRDPRAACFVGTVPRLLSSSRTAQADAAPGPNPHSLLPGKDAQLMKPLNPRP